MVRHLPNQAGPGRQRAASRGGIGQDRTGQSLYLQRNSHGPGFDTQIGEQLQCIGIEIGRRTAVDQNILLRLESLHHLLPQGRHIAERNITTEHEMNSPVGKSNPGFRYSRHSGVRDNGRQWGKLRFNVG
jgi:hypothetical protein